MNGFIDLLKRFIRNLLSDLIAFTVFVWQVIILTRERIKLRLDLSRYIDPQVKLQVVNEMREQLLREDRIRLQESEQQTVIANQFRQFLAAYVNLMAAIVKYYDYPDNPYVTKEEHASAPEEFKRAKTHMLMYCRWLAISGVPAFGIIADNMESVNLDSFSSVNEWIEFFENNVDTVTPPNSANL